MKKVFVAQRLRRRGGFAALGIGVLEQRAALQAAESKTDGHLLGCPSETVEKVAQPLFRVGLHEIFTSISCEIVGKNFARSVISEAHVLGNDRIKFYSAVCGRRNSLQEGFFDKLRRTSFGMSVCFAGRFNLDIFEYVRINCKCKMFKIFFASQ